MAMPNANDPLASLRSFPILTGHAISKPEKRSAATLPCSLPAGIACLNATLYSDKTRMPATCMSLVSQGVRDRPSMLDLKPRHDQS